MYCKNCTQEIDENAAFCPNCGAPVEPAVPEQPQETESVFSQTAPNESTFPMNTTTVGTADPNATPQDRAAAVAAAAANFSKSQGEPRYADPQQETLFSTYQPNYVSEQPPIPNGQQNKNIGTVPLVLGILSIVLAVFLGWTIIGAIAGIVLGILGMSKGKKALAIEPENGSAKGGRVTGIIGLILNILTFIAMIVITVVLGMFITEVANNPDVLVEEMEKIAALDDTGEAQKELDELKQELEGLGMESGLPQAPYDYTNGRSFDTWAAECTAAGDQPTLYALIELEGWQLETMLQELGYQYYPAVDTWERESDGTYYGMVSEQGTTLTDKEIATGGAGGSGLNAYHVLTVKGFDSIDAALSQMGQVVTDDVIFSDDNEAALAVVHGPSMTEYLVLMGPSELDGAGYYDFIVFPQEACESGLFNEVYGADTGTSIDEIWQTITGVPVGDYISNS